MQITINMQKIIPFLLMVFFAMYASLDFNAIDLPMASYALLALMLMGGLFLFFKIARDKTIAKTDLIFFFFIAIIALSSFIHGTDAKNWIYTSISILLIRFAFYFYNDQIKYLTLGLAFGLNIGLFAQLHQLITQPQIWIIPDAKEVTVYLFGGNYNQIGIRILLTLVINFLCMKISKLFYFLLVPSIIVGIAIPIMVSSMTATTCIILFLMLCILPTTFIRRTSFKLLILFIVLFQIFVCFTGNGIENNEFAVWFVEDVLGKDITFTYRTHMWDSALRIIVESPFLGYGYPDGIWYRSHMTSFAIGPHNIILATLIYGGISTFVIYLYLLTRSMLHAYNIPDRWADYLLMGIATASLMMLMEVYSLSLIFTLITLAEYYPQLHQQLSYKHE